jgi:spermidine synthase
VVLNVAAARRRLVVVERPSSLRRTRPNDQKRGRPAFGLTARGACHSAVAPRVAAFALAISGAAALVQQIAWTRILALILGPTTYAFSATVADIPRRDRDRRSCGRLADPARAVGRTAGRRASRVGPQAPLTALSLVPFAVKWIASAVAAPGASFGSIVRLQTTFVAALIAADGPSRSVAAFPLAVSLAVRSDRPVSSDVAVAYAANTVGAIAGALAGGDSGWCRRWDCRAASRAAAALATAGFIVITILMAAGGTAAGVAREKC